MRVENWGLIAYQEATERQLALVQNFQEDTLVVCTHPPVVTLGRGSKANDVIGSAEVNGWQGEIFETSRGGRATYHGPSQIVIYPILNLNSDLRKTIQKRDLHSYMRALEAAIVTTLKCTGVSAEVKSDKPDEKGRSLTGVWVGDKKIASIGIAVKNWITYHGVAINIHQDQNAFKGINPCGFSTEVMTSLEEVLDKKVDRTSIEREFEKQFITALS